MKLTETPISENNMYSASVMQWNVFKGCLFDCIYCEKSYKRQAKRQKQNCIKCYNYEPHKHPERVNNRFPKTNFGEFIWACSSGDISFCDTEFLSKIIKRIESEPDKNFLLQSKNPKTFERVSFPNNVILGITLETNRDGLYTKNNISKAPLPSQRYNDFLKVKHPVKMITIEPVMKFDIGVMLEWIENINPCMIWLGYDSKETHHYDPTKEEFKELYWELGKKGFVTILKVVRG